jgi:GT2 family glycosyltransferase
MMNRITTTGRPSRFSPGDTRPEAIGLVAERDVRKTASGWTATSDEPWLRFDVDAGALAGRWVELAYDAGFSGAVTRPLLRCLAPDGAKDEILPGPVMGRALWIGKIPPNATGVLVSPINTEGAFAFRIASMRFLSLFQLAARGWSGRPRYVMGGLGHGLIGWSFEAERHFRRALHSTPLHASRSWTDARRRPPEWDGFDLLPVEAANGPLIRVVATSAEPSFLDGLLAQCRAQPWPRWSLAAPTTKARADVRGYDGEALVSTCIADLGPRDLVLAIRPGEVWGPEALAMMGAAALRDDNDVYYGDEESSGGRTGLRLKPDWSPILAGFADLTGRAWVLRADWARRAIGERRAVEMADHPLPVDETTRATHLRRVLARCAASTHTSCRSATRPSSPVAEGAPCATIVIPTRDRVDLLRACIESLRRVEGRTDFEAIVVDNGSTDPAALAYLTEIGGDLRFRVLRRPGPFNFSALSNAGAAEARARRLVFLNNDVEAQPHWLDRLLSWTDRPSVGAVGAKLVYPDGRVQHAGVTLGVDGHAAHFERFCAPDAPGYFGRFNLPHEVLAVTGACLAVEKAKFDAVGGFDAINLPVEFSDVDLCLRLAERGWTALMEPAARLVHREAASRKVWRSQERRYAGQVAYFKQRWRARLRDDPYFHPALSLDWHKAALG